MERFNNSETIHWLTRSIDQHIIVEKRVVFWDPTLKKTPTHNCTLAHCNHTLCSVLHQVSFFQSAHGRRCVLHRPTKTHAVDIFSANFFWKISSAEALYRFFRDWGSWSIPQGVEHAGTRLSSFQLSKSKKILLSIKGLLVAMKKTKTVKWNNKASSCTKVAVRQIGFRKPARAVSRVTGDYLCKSTWQKPESQKSP